MLSLAIFFTVKFEDRDKRNWYKEKLYSLEKEKKKLPSLIKSKMLISVKSRKITFTDKILKMLTCHLKLKKKKYILLKSIKV